MNLADKFRRIAREKIAITKTFIVLSSVSLKAAFCWIFSRIVMNRTNNYFFVNLYHHHNPDLFNARRCRRCRFLHFFVTFDKIVPIISVPCHFISLPSRCCSNSHMLLLHDSRGTPFLFLPDVLTFHTFLLKYFISITLSFLVLFKVFPWIIIISILVILIYSTIA